MENWRHNELCEGSQTYRDTFATFSLHCTVHIVVYTYVYVVKLKKSTTLDHDGLEINNTITIE